MNNLFGVAVNKRTECTSWIRGTSGKRETYNTKEPQTSSTPCQVKASLPHAVAHTNGPPLVDTSPRAKREYVNPPRPIDARGDRTSARRLLTGSLVTGTNEVVETREILTNVMKNDHTHPSTNAWTNRKRHQQWIFGRRTPILRARAFLPSIFHPAEHSVIRSQPRPRRRGALAP